VRICMAERLCVSFRCCSGDSPSCPVSLAFSRWDTDTISDVFCDSTINEWQHYRTAYKNHDQNVGAKNGFQISVRAM
jgi:hypothetical protein